MRRSPVRRSPVRLGKRPTSTFPGMSDDVVLYEEREPGIALITLNRPERLNAWTAELGDRYFSLLDRAAADEAIKVIVVIGLIAWCSWWMLG